MCSFTKRFCPSIYFLLNTDDLLATSFRTETGTRKWKGIRWNEPVRATDIHTGGYLLVTTVVFYSFRVKNGFCIWTRHRPITRLCQLTKKRINPSLWSQGNVSRYVWKGLQVVGKRVEDKKLHERTVENPVLRLSINKRGQNNKTRSSRENWSRQDGSLHQPLWCWFLVFL